MTLSEIPWNVLANGGFGGLVAFAIWGIFTGRLIPRITYEEMKEERDRWRQVAEESLKQNGQLLESARTVDATFKALERVAGREPAS